jgi:hypothetical protein
MADTYNNGDNADMEADVEEIPSESNSKGWNSTARGQIQTECTDALEASSIKFTNGAVYVDPSRGSSGTAYPLGESITPVDNISDALTIAIANNLARILFANDGSTYSLPANVQRYELIGIGLYSVVINMNSKDLSGSRFVGIYADGTMASFADFYQCYFVTFTAFLGRAEDCVFAVGGTLELANGNSYIIDSEFAPIAGTGYTIDFTNLSSKNIVLDNISGTLILDNLTNAGSKVYISSADGLNLTINASCTAGTIIISGNVTITDNSGGSTVTIQTIQGSDGDSLKDLSDQIDNVQGVHFFKDFWTKMEDSSPTITIPAVAADLTFPDVVIDALPTNATIVKVECMLKYRYQEDTSGGANAIDGANKTIRVKKSTGGWGTDDLIAIKFPDNSLDTDASTKEGGDVLFGGLDVKAEVDGAATYNFRSDETNRSDAIVVDTASLVLGDVQMGIRVHYTV